MRALLACFVLLAGCKQIFGIQDPVLANDSGLPDEGAEDADSGDGGTETCFAAWLDGTVQLGTAFSVVSEPGQQHTPHVSDDELAIWYVSDPTGTDFDVYRATRSSRSASFGAGIAVPDLNSADDEYDVSFSADLQSVVVTTNRPGGADLFDIASGLRSDASQPFASLGFSQTTALNSDDSELDASLSADGLEVFFTRDIAVEIFVATRPSTSSAFGAPMQFDLGGANDFFPSISRDDRILLFDSDRNVAGTRELFYVTRSGRGSPFGVVTPVPLLSTYDSEAHLSADGCTLYFTRGTLDGNGDIIDSDLWAVPVVR